MFIRRQTLAACLLSATLLGSFQASAETVIRRGTGASPGTLDPHKSELLAESIVLYDLLEGLLTPDGKGGFRPAMATGWTISPDAKTYTFTLRRDAKWSDGTPVTADDFVYSWRRLVKPETASPYAYYLWTVENGEAITKGQEKDLAKLGVSAPDPHTFVVRLVKPAGYFLSMLQHTATFPVHRASVEKHGDQFTQPGNYVTNGAYVMTENVPQSHMKLVKSKTYYEADQVKIDTVMAYPIDNLDTEFKKFRAGELDVTYTLPTTQVRWARDNLKEAFREHQTFSTFYLSFNHRNEPWKSNPKLREALSLAVDREAIAEKVLNGERAAYSFTPPGTGGYDQPGMPSWVKLSQAERDARAKQLMAEAGYGPGGKPLPPVEIVYFTSENARKVMIATAAMWKQKLGVETLLNNQEFRVVSDIGNEKAYKDLLFFSWIGDYPDANSFLTLLRSDVSLQNFPDYRNPAFDAMLEQANTLVDPAARVAKLKEAETMMMADTPVVPIFHNLRRRLVNPKVQGWVPNALDFYPTRFLEMKG
ncbi:MAG TPA: peptide ABC transporter substrate-binding protein [Azospirillaceae bacterium]|nr:peptide ABC transporter substrate-binding protein [Azospirillaceae bacterium]